MWEQACPAKGPGQAQVVYGQGFALVRGASPLPRATLLDLLLILDASPLIVDFSSEAVAGCAFVVKRTYSDAMQR